MTHGVLVLPADQVRPGHLILRVYGESTQQVDDGNRSGDQSHGELPLSLVTSVEVLASDLLVARLACGTEVPLSTEGHVEVVSR